MAKEGELKKVDLKVSVICCDGCKRKVKKALQSIPGVLDTQVDAIQPKVTVTGKVDAQVLIRRLGRVGKQAELWPSENQKPNKEEKNAGINNKEPQAAAVSGKDKENMNKSSNTQRCKCSGACNTDKSKESDSGNSGGNKKGVEKDQKQCEEGCKNGCAAKNTNPPPPPPPPPPPQEGIVHEGGNVGSYAAPHYYFVEPSTLAYPCYALNACSAPPPYHFQDRYVYEMPMMSRVVVQAPGPRFTDYFNDENTAGCSVM